MYHSLFIHSLTERYLGCFQVLTITNKAAINSCVHDFCGQVFKSFGETQSNMIVGSCGRSMFSFIRNPPTLFHSGWIIWQPPWQCTRVSAALYPGPHCLSSAFWLSLSLIGALQCLIIILGCISLRTNMVWSFFS